MLSRSARMMLFSSIGARWKSFDHMGSRRGSGWNGQGGRFEGKGRCDMNNRFTFNFSLITTTIGILFGLALHYLAVYLRDNGPSFGGISFQGNGASVVLAVAVIGLIIGEIVCVRRRAWLGVIVLPFAIFIVLFVIAGLL